MSAPLLFDGCEIAARIAPESAQALAAALADLAGRGAAALVRGGGSRLATGNPLRRADAVLETGGLARLLELDADEGVLRAEAGATLEALRRAAEPTGWELPLDPPGAGATLGGTLAAAAGGPRFPRPREAVLGLDVALPSGALTRSGGRVVKNVTGYDLPKLFTGSFGALGVIASAWVRLRPLPEARALLALPLPDAARALVAARRPSARAAVALDARVAASVVPGADGDRLLVELAGDAPAVEADATWLRAELGADAAPETALEAARSLAGAALREGELLLRVAVVASEVAPAWAALRAAGATLVAEPARGLVRARATLPPEADPVPAAAPLLGAARAAAARGRGSWRIEAAPLALRREVDVFGDPGPQLALLRRLKVEYDPGAVLNPGRFAGRL
jgi:glycolate oxidase FAD binding subunit